MADSVKPPEKIDLYVELLNRRFKPKSATEVESGEEFFQKFSTSIISDQHFNQGSIEEQLKLLAREDLLNLIKIFCEAKNKQKVIDDQNLQLVLKAILLQYMLKVQSELDESLLQEKDTIKKIDKAHQAIIDIEQQVTDINAAFSVIGSALPIFAFSEYASSNGDSAPKITDAIATKIFTWSATPIPTPTTTPASTGMSDPAGESLRKIFNIAQILKTGQQVDVKDRAEIVKNIDAKYSKLKAEVTEKYRKAREELAKPSQNAGGNSLEEKKVNCIPIRKAYEKSPNVLNIIEEKKVSFVVNLSKSPSEIISDGEKDKMAHYIGDGFKIRRSSVDNQIPLFTDLHLARAFIKALLHYKVSDLEIKSYKEYLQD